MNTGGTDAARTILTAIAAAVITVVGVVFSITILALQLASTQFGPRMLRNFIRDRGTQLTLGTFVATFVFSVLALGSVSNKPSGAFVPHISVSVAIVLLLVDLGVLIYFIHHVARSIQLTEVVYAIARGLDQAIRDLHTEKVSLPHGSETLEPAVNEINARLDREGVELPAPSSGYLQGIGHARIVDIAANCDAVVRFSRRPGHFVVCGRPLATVWPAEAAPEVTIALADAHITGRIGRCSRIRSWRSISSSRSRYERSRRRSTTHSRRSPASIGSETGSAKSHDARFRTGSTRTRRAVCEFMNNVPRSPGKLT